MINGEKRQSMMLAPQFDKDPLRRKKHKVLVSEDGGKNYTIIGNVDDPIELLKLQVAGEHALGFPQADVVIVDESNTVVADFPTYYVEPQAGEPDARRIELRDKWLDAVMKFLLPFKLYSEKDKPNRQHRLARWFKAAKIAIEMRPDGGAVRIWRDGEILSSWGC